MASPQVGFQPIAFQSSPAAFQAGPAIFLFGDAIITIPQQTPIQPVRSCFIEGTAFELSVSYFDIFGDPGVPVTVYYQILERATWFAIAAWTPINTSYTNYIFIPSASNMVVDKAHKWSEAHVIQFQITDGVGNVFYRSAAFDVLRDVGVEAGVAPANEPAFQLIGFEEDAFQQGITPQQ